MPYPHPQSPKNLIGSARITKVVLGSPGEQLLHLLDTSYATVEMSSVERDSFSVLQLMLVELL